MKTRYLIILLLSLSALLSGCTDTYLEEEGSKWDGEGTPVWLKEKTMLLYADEVEPITSSYLAGFSYQTYKFSHNDSYYIAIQYVSSGFKEIKRNLRFFSDTGKKIEAKGLKESFELSKQLIETNKIGGKDGYIPQIENFIIDDKDVSEWVQVEIDQLCEQVEETDETIFHLIILAFKDQSDTYVSIHKTYLMPSAITLCDSKKLFYTKDGKLIDETSELHKEVSQLESSDKKTTIALWGKFVSI